MKIENHIGKPVIVWWTADKNVHLIDIQSKDYSKIKVAENVYPKVIPKGQTIPFPVKKFSRETQVNKKEKKKEKERKKFFFFELNIDSFLRTLIRNFHSTFKPSIFLNLYTA